MTQPNPSSNTTRPCPTCKGSGKCPAFTPHDNIKATKTCNACNGTGHIEASKVEFDKPPAQRFGEPVELDPAKQVHSIEEIRDRARASKPTGLVGTMHEISKDTPIEYVTTSAPEPATDYRRDMPVPNPFLGETHVSKQAKADDNKTDLLRRYNPPLELTPETQSAGTDHVIEPLGQIVFHRLNRDDGTHEEVLSKRSGKEIATKLNQVIAYINDHNNPKEVKDE